MILAMITSADGWIDRLGARATAPTETETETATETKTKTKVNRMGAQAETAIKAALRPGPSAS